MPTSGSDSGLTSQQSVRRQRRLGDSVRVERGEIRSALQRLPAKMTSGMDCIPSLLLKKCLTVFIDPLRIIFNAALHQGVFPDEWKKAKIIPVFKSGIK